MSLCNLYNLTTRPRKAFFIVEANSNLLCTYQSIAISFFSHAKSRHGLHGSTHDGNRRKLIHPHAQTQLFILFFLLPFFPGVHVSTQSPQPIDPRSWVIDQGCMIKRSSRPRIDQTMPVVHDPKMGDLLVGDRQAGRGIDPRSQTHGTSDARSRGTPWDRVRLWYGERVQAPGALAMPRHARHFLFLPNFMRT
jgi:hypothetical protein